MSAVVPTFKPVLHVQRAPVSDSLRHVPVCKRVRASAFNNGSHDAKDTKGVHSVAHSIRPHGALLRTAVSSTARTTVHGAAGREAVRNGCR